MSRDELIVLVGEQAGRIAVQDGQITVLATRMAGLVEASEDLASWLAPDDHSSPEPADITDTPSHNSHNSHNSHSHNSNTSNRPLIHR